MKINIHATGKFLILFICFVLVAAVFSFSATEQQEAVAVTLTAKDTASIKTPVTTDTSAKKLKTTRVVVYYFYTTYRCSNCYKIETNSRAAVEKYFVPELSSGKLVYKMLNVDDTENKHFIQDYQLYTKSLVIVLYKKGKQIKFENLNGVWKYLNDKNAFQKYVKVSVEKYLKEIK